jgi:hypothetical protein
VHGIIAVPSRWRLDHDIYALPFELYLKDRVDQFLKPPKSKVDAHRLETELVQC